MLSIRRSRTLALIVGVGMLGGCQLQMGPRAPMTGGLSNAPIKTDAAMETRQWDVTMAHYANDAVFAYPTYTPLDPDSLRYKLNAITETFLFLGDTIYTPIGVFIEVPWKWEAYKSLALEPSYTLMPVLPNGAEAAPTAY